MIDNKKESTKITVDAFRKQEFPTISLTHQFDTHALREPVRDRELFNAQFVVPLSASGLGIPTAVMGKFNVITRTINNNRCHNGRFEES